VGAAALEGAFSKILGPEAGGASAQALAEIGETLVGYVESRAQQRVARTLQATSEEIASHRAEGRGVRSEIRDLQNDGALSLFESVVRAASWRQLVALRYFEDPDRKRERELIGAAGAEVTQ
jgi:hypothetical protein